MDRRTFLIRSGALYAVACFGSRTLTASRTDARVFNRFKLGAISDGFSQDFGEALKTMKSFGLGWVEIRKVFGIYNTEASVPQVKRLKELLDEHQFRVSVIDSALYKCTLPGTKPAVSEKDAYPYPEQMELLKRACDRAHSLGAEKIRGFTFWRVADPGKVSRRIKAELEKAAEVCRGAGMRLVIENEETCNVATGRELGEILKMTPVSNLGANWDVGNGYWKGEVSFPTGYHSLEKSRIWHMHLKGVTCAKDLTNCTETSIGEGQIDLAGQFNQLLRDGYHETMSLECEFVKAGLSHLETSKRSLEGLLKILDSTVQRG